MTFRRGQKVVCVDDSPGRKTGVVFNIRRGRVYTISQVIMGRDAVTLARGLGVDLVEEPHPANIATTIYCATRFRPAVDKKTDISIFKKMLTPVKENA